MKTSSFPHACIYVTPTLRDRIRKSAELNGRSLITEVSVTLLLVYKPLGWALLINDVQIHSRRTQSSSPTEFDAERECLSVHVPPALKEKIATAAKAAFRSWSAEAARALTKRYGP